MTARTIAQDPGDAPRALPADAELPRADRAWLYAWRAWSNGPPKRPKVQHPPLTKPGMTHAAAQALVDSGECDGLGFVVDDRLRAKVSDAELRAAQAAGV